MKPILETGSTVLNPDAFSRCDVRPHMTVMIRHGTTETAWPNTVEKGLLPGWLKEGNYRQEVHFSPISYYDVFHKLYVPNFDPEDTPGVTFLKVPYESGTDYPVEVQCSMQALEDHGLIAK